MSKVEETTTPGNQHLTQTTKFAIALNSSPPSRNCSTHSRTPDFAITAVNMMQPKEETETTSFLDTLPLELRELVYVHLFTYKSPFYTIINERVCLNAEARGDLRLLRTCRTIYIEGMRVLHALNSFTLHYIQMHALDRLPESNHLLVGAAVVKCNDFGIGGLGDGQEVENINFGTIARHCPMIQHLEVVTYHPGSLLWTVQTLTKSLPCSPIRQDPLLQVDVAILESQNNGNFSDTSTAAGVVRNPKVKVMHGTSENRSSWLSAPSAFRLGSEMPRFLKTIRVKGTLSRSLCRVIENHRSTFGDCQFEKRKLRETFSVDALDMPIGVMQSDALEVVEEGKRALTLGDMLQDTYGTLEYRRSGSKSDVGSHLRYTWCRNGQVVRRHEAQDNQVISGLNRWVPQLNHAWYEKMMEDGLEVDYDKLPAKFLNMPTKNSSSTGVQTRTMAKKLRSYSDGPS